MVPGNLRYMASHEWAKVDGDLCTVGITSFAVEQLTDVVFVELPKKGRTVAVGQAFGQIESVKAVSDLYAPVSGEVVEINQSVVDDPSQISADAFGKGWMLKIKLASPADLDKLLTAEQYEKQIASQGH
jgi:glycine cleavage system H protein